jgi:diguanylate cyclase (GGDEF)-like protein/PAS domain S-box-containing protein
VATDTPIDESLRLARDLCLGVGAFYVTEAGSVFSSMSDVMRPENADERVAALARSCLMHPSARGTGLFWSAESTDDGGALQPEWSLACVVAPVWRDDRWLGLLGVVDVWLPELDDEQRSGLLALASEVGAQAERQDAAAARAQHDLAGGAPAAGAPAGHPRPDTSAEPFLGEILDHLPDGLLVARSDGTIVLVNQTFAQMTGLPLDTVLGEDVTRVLATAEPGPGGEVGAGAGGRETLLQNLLGEPEPGRTVLVGRDGVTLDAAGRRIESRFAGDCFVTLVRAKGAAGAAGQDRGIEQAGIQALLDHIEDGIVCCDAQGIVVIANRAARRLQGLSDGELRVGASLPSVVRLQTLEGHALSVDEHPLVRSMLDDVPVSEEFLLRGEEVERYVSISSHPLRVDGGDGAIAVLRDVTAERERQAHLTRYALYDPLTGVANRYLLNDALGRMLEGLHRKGGSVSLIYLDLDRFKEINDEHGHETGDELLRAVAMRLGRAVRGEDIVARLGGDEFVVAHVTTERLSDGDAVVARVRKVLTAPYRFGDLVLDVGASIGWVSTSSGDDSPESLIAQADRAMYEQKHQRRAAEQGAPA